MAGLFLTRTDDEAAANAALATAREQFAAHGFAPGTDHVLPGWRLLHFAHIIGGPDSLFAEGDDLVAVAGTLSFDGLIGRPALQVFLRSATLPDLDWSRIGGQFVALVRKQGRMFLFTDYFATFQLFHDGDRRMFSTSLLAAAKALPRLSFDAQGVYEFAFNVVPIGDDTVFADLKLLGPGRIVELTPAGAIQHGIPKPLPALPAALPMAERIDRHRDRLMAIVQAQVDHFGDSIHCPLSGGIDSRLVLAALRAAGSKPHVYVYGPDGSEDVAIALAIGAAQGFDVEWINKAESRHVSPEGFADQVARNFHEFDALPTYGNIFDNGGNAAARDARHAGGGLAVSGGCGEIYRDFFFLPDRQTHVGTVARTFFARYARGDVTGAFDEAAFLHRLGDKIAGALELPEAQRKLPRAVLEQVYPRVRCRSLFGREISLEARYGAYFMPFLDHQVVAEAMTLPMPLKQVGRFESMLLTAIDPVLARQPSAYGHHFAGPPSPRHRMSEWSSRARPAWLRQKSYAIQRRLRPMGDEHGGLLSAEYMNRVIDPELPAMRRFFHIDRITDSGMWRRLACLEYLAAHLGSRLR